MLLVPYRIWIVLTVFGLFCLTEACSIQKRRYRPGYHTETPEKPTGTSEHKKNPTYAGDTSTAKNLSSPFLNDTTNNRTTYHYCDTLYFNDGHRISVTIVGRNGNDINYKECGNSQGQVHSVSVNEINSIKKADGYVVNMSSIKTSDQNNAAENDKDGCDKIYFTNGAEKWAHVTATNSDEIKYKECGNKDGIIYGVARKEVLMIKRANGSYDSINTPPDSSEDHTQETTSTPQNDPDNILNDRFFWFMIDLVLHWIF